MASDESSARSGRDRDRDDSGAVAAGRAGDRGTGRADGGRVVPPTA